MQFLSTPSARRATPGRYLLSRAQRDFYPRPPRGGRRKTNSSMTMRTLFLSTPSARRATKEAPKEGDVKNISIHALREEGDAGPPMLFLCRSDFYPRPPRGGRHYVSYKLAEFEDISIHALREEGDVCKHILLRSDLDFYPRPPRGGRHIINVMTRQSGLFLSTPSARRATGNCPRRAIAYNYFYPRPPRGGRRAAQSQLSAGTYFYPRPPRGGRRFTACRDCISFKFLSTPSARRATNGNELQQHGSYISIHALREEGDLPCGLVLSVLLVYFYPRPPRGGRLGT